MRTNWILESVSSMDFVAFTERNCVRHEGQIFCSQLRLAEKRQFAKRRSVLGHQRFSL